MSVFNAYNPYGTSQPSVSGYYAAQPSYGAYGTQPAPSYVTYGAQPAPSVGLGYYGGQTYAAAPAAPAAPVQAPLQLDENMEAEISARVSHLGQRRAPVLRRQIIKVPGPAGRVQQVVRRIPTPQPDVIEKVIVSKPQRDVINLLIERPATPPPTIQEKRIQARPHKPAITQQVVRVAPRTVQQPVAQSVQQVQYQPIAVQPVAVQPVSVYPGYGSYGSFGSYDSSPSYAGYGQPAYSAAQPAYSGAQLAYSGAQPAYSGYYPGQSYGY
jgi:hypothetical protein